MKIIIEGEFKIKGLKALKDVKQPLEYIELEILQMPVKIGNLRSKGL